MQRSWLGFGAACFLGCSLAATPHALAQEQLIEDPELTGTPTSTPSKPAVETSSTTSTSSDATVRALVHTRAAADTRHELPREDVYDSETIAVLEASVRRSESLRFALGMRARHRFATMVNDLPDVQKEHVELDVVPTAGYADWLVTDGLHLQIGYQPVHLGRFDVLSATNFLEISDLRDGPATLPEGGTLAQFAALVDYDITSWLSLRAVYVPFFTPNLIAVTEGDYAIFPLSQPAVDAAIEGAAGDANADRQLRRRLYENLSRADRDQLSRAALNVFVPEPTFANPQGALRLSAHGPAGELALTVGTALEHLPTLDPSITLLEAIAADPDDIQAPMRLAGDPHPVRVLFNRFAVFSVDGAADVGPLSLGAELAYMLDRTFYAGNEDPSALCGRLDDETAGGTTGCLRAGQSDLLHLGLRGEYVQTTEWVVTIESFVAYALNTPATRYPGDDRSDPVDRQWLLLDDGRFLWGSAALARFSPDAFPIELELSAGIFNGPTLVIMPRIAYGLLENLDAEIGALFVEGDDNPATSASAIAFGSIYNTVDQVYIGLRYLP